MPDVNQSTLCPVCGYDLGFLPWNDNSAADEICPSCGIQFGYDDAAGGDVVERRHLYHFWRDEWIAKGMPWSSRGQSQPSNWNPAIQLRRIEAFL